MKSFFCLLLLGLLLAPRSARAHEVGLSKGDYRRQAQVLEVELVLAQRDAASLVSELDSDASGSTDEHELARGRPGLERALLGEIQVGAKAGPCTTRLLRAEITERDGLLVAGRLECPRASDETWEVTLGFVGRLSRGHRHVARVASRSGSREELLYGESPAFEVAVGAADTSERPHGAGGFFRLGVEHILGGYDHLLFLFALVLAGGRLRSLVAVVSAFTLGHTLALTWATFGGWAPSPSWIEPGIALSIAYVALENLLGLDPAKRWRVALPFGLLHGFGFSGALLDAGLSQSELPKALLFFNTGVELGQVALIGLAFPLLAVLRDWQRLPRYALPAINVVLVGAGTIWCCLRVLA